MRCKIVKSCFPESSIINIQRSRIHSVVCCVSKGKPIKIAKHPYERNIQEACLRFFSAFQTWNFPDPSAKHSELKEQFGLQQKCHVTADRFFLKQTVRKFVWVVSCISNLKCPGLSAQNPKQAVSYDWQTKRSNHGFLLSILDTDHLIYNSSSVNENYAPGWNSGLILLKYMHMDPE